MRWSDDLELGNNLDDIDICSVYQRDTLTVIKAHLHRAKTDMKRIYKLEIEQNHGVLC